MRQDKARIRALSVALVATAAGGVFAGPAAAGGNEEKAGGPPPQAPAHGARGETPPAHAPAHGVRGTQPSGEAGSAAAPKPAGARRSAKSRGTAPKPSRGAKSRGAGPKPSRSAPPAHAPAHGVRGTKPAKKAKPADDARTKENSAGGRPKVTLCHATGSDKNPYVTITIADRGVEHGHDDHQADGDIIPAPEGGCPAPAEQAARAAAGLRSGARGGETPASGTAASGSPVTPAGESEIITSSAMGTTGEPEGRIQVLGEVDTEAGTAETASAAQESPAAAPTPAADAPNGLPFTGIELIAVVLAGLAALLTGLALWRATRAPRRPTA